MQRYSLFLEMSNVKVSYFHLAKVNGLIKNSRFKISVSVYNIRSTQTMCFFFV